MGFPGSNPSGAPFHILHFVSDVFCLVSKNSKSNVESGNERWERAHTFFEM